MLDTYRITKFDTAHGCDVMLRADGYGWTLHADKAASFPTLEAALLALGLVYDEPTAVVSRGPAR
jgi:hypothetical protein